MTALLQGATGGLYRGPDRRGRNEGLLVPVSQSRVIVMALVVTAGAWVPALFVIPDKPSAGDVGAYAAIVGGLLFTVAGGMKLIAWKISGRAFFGWLGAAFISFGLTIAVSDGFSTFGVDPESSVRHVGDLIAAVLAGWMIYRGLTDEEVNASVRPLGALGCALGGALAVVGLVHFAQMDGSLPAWVAAGPTVMGVNGVSSLVWVSVAVVAGRAAHRSRSCMSPAIIPVAALLAVSAAIRVFSPIPWASTIAASGCIFAAAAVTLGASIARVQDILALKDTAQRTLQLALTASAHQADREHRSLETWLHDLRNSVAGLQAANAVLRDNVGVGGGTHPELADAVTAELARLHALVGPARQLRIATVDLAPALAPVLAAERALGACVELHLEAPQVAADGNALCRILQNLLANARLYAPGSPVTVMSTLRGPAVTIAVQDDGPGIGAGEQALVFERGGRGRAASGTDGSGLGLYVAMTLATAMGGSLTVGTGAGRGCCIQLTLPAPLADPVPGARVAPVPDGAHASERPRAKGRGPHHSLKGAEATS